MDQDRTDHAPLRDLQEELSNLRSLMTQRGYAYFGELCEKYANVRHQKIYLQPLESVDAVYRQEYEKGTIFGIVLMANAVPARIQELEREIEERLKEEEGDQNERSSESDGQRNPSDERDQPELNFERGSP